MGPPGTKLSDRHDFRELFDHFDSVALWTVEEEGEFAYISSGFEEIWGVSRDEIRDDIGRLLESVHPEDRADMAAFVQRPESEVAQDSIEHRVVHPDGTVRWVEARAFPIHDADGEVLEIVGISIDVTERKRREEELEVLNRVLRHDVRNEMAVVTGWLDALDDAVTEDGREIVERVQAAGEHVVELTDVARDLVDVVVGDGEFELDPVHVGRTLETELESRRMAYPEATFEIEGAPPDVTVAGNQLLASVFRNLLNNAVQHADEGAPRVVVRTAVTPESVRIEVADDGPGIADERKDAVFGKGNSGLDSAGTGMGLYLCRKIVDGFGGRIWIEDNEPTGAVVCVEFPRAEAAGGG